MRAALIKKCIPMLVCACFPFTGLAATITTDQPGAWSDPATWLGGQAPSRFDDVLLDHAVFESVTIFIRSINGPGSLTYGGNLNLVGGGANSQLTNVAGGGVLDFYGGGNLDLVDATGVTGRIDIQEGYLSFAMVNSVLNASSVRIRSISMMSLSGFNQEIQNLNAEGRVELGSADMVLSGNSSISGELTGLGSIYQSGPGSVLTISGNNTSFFGNTDIRGDSKLIVGHDNALGSGRLDLLTGTLSNAGNRTIANNIDLTTSVNIIEATPNTRFEVAGNITGLGTLRKIGTGELVFSGTNNFGGYTYVEQGTLRLASTGSISTGVVVENTGTLSGTGNFGSFIDVLTGGTLSPGNSIGTMTVGGALFFHPGSQFNVELDATGASDRVDVAQFVTIDPGATLNIDGAAGTYGPSTTYTLINAVGGFNGNFDFINSNLAFLTPDLFINGNLLQLTLTNNGIDFVDVARTYNQRNAALGLMSVGAGTLATAVTSLDGNTARSAFGQLTGEIHASAQGALVDDTDFVRSAVTQRLYQPDGNAVWFKASSTHGYTDRNSNTDSTSRHMNGGLVGSDRSIGDGNWTAGLFGGYGDTNFNTQRSRADIKTVHLGAYAGRSFDNIQLKLGTGYAYHRLDTSRNLGFGTFTGRDKADYDAHSLQAFADVGYRIKSGDGSIEPFLNLAQVYLSREGFNERGDEAALRVGREQSNVTLGTIGVRLDQPITTSSSFPLRLQGSLGYRHAEGDVTPKSEARLAGGSSFDVRGNPIARQAAVYDIGLYSQLSPTLSAGINYRGQSGDNTRIHAANFNLTWLF